MALFLEDTEKVTQKQIPIPQNAKKVFKAMEKVYEPYLDKAEGGHVLKSLASDKHYNKKGNDKLNGKDKKIDTINVDDAKVRLHRMNQFSPNSIEYQMYGGELGKNVMKNGIQHARGVQTVDIVKPPKPTSNAEVKPAVVKTKEIETPNGKISYTVTSENKKPKKIYISEEAIKTLYEDYRQLKLPFKNDSGKGYDYKENYELFIDWLESVGKYGRLEPYNGEDFNETVKKLEWQAYYKYIHEWDIDDNFLSFVLEIMLDETLKNNTTKKYFKLPEDIINGEYSFNEIFDSLNLDGSLENAYKHLTDEGIKWFEKESFSRFKFYVADALYNIEKDDRGLIYIEREISIPSMFKTQYDKKISPENDDFFKNISKYYKGIGICWSWEKGAGEAYNGDWFDVGNDYITLKGWTRPDSIDWVTTMQINAQMGNSEKELRLHNGVIVEVDEIIITGYNASEETKGKNILNKPILIPT